MSAPPPFGYLFAGVAVADLAAEIDWYTRLFGRPPDILPNSDEAMWGATGSGSVYLLRRPGRAGNAHLALAVDDVDRWVAELAGRGPRTWKVRPPWRQVTVLAWPPPAAIAPATPGTSVIRRLRVQTWQLLARLRMTRGPTPWDAGHTVRR